MYSPCTVTASSWVVTAASSARAGCASAAPTARNRPWRRGRDRVFGDVMAWTLAAPGRLDVLVQTDAAARGRHVLLAGVSPGSVEADGPAGLPGAVGVLGRTDVVHVLEEAVLGIDRDRGHRRLVGAVDVVRAQGGGGEHGAGLVGGVDVGGGGGVHIAHFAAEWVGKQLDGGAGAGDVEAHVSLLLVGRGRRGHQHAVPHVRLGALVHLDQRIQARVGGVDGEVGDLRGRGRGAVDRGPLEDRAGVADALDRRGLAHDQAVLDAAVPAPVGIQRVVVGPGDDAVAAVGGAAEDLDAVVAAVVRLEVADPGAAADADQGQRLQLVAGAQHVAGVAHLHVAQLAA